MQVFHMIVDSMGAAFEVLGDHSNRVPKDQLIEYLMFAIGQPCLWVIHLLKGDVGFS